jgi:hypothetical protein
MMRTAAPTGSKTHASPVRRRRARDAIAKGTARAGVRADYPKAPARLTSGAWRSSFSS